MIKFRQNIATYDLSIKIVGGVPNIWHIISTYCELDKSKFNIAVQKHVNIHCFVNMLYFQYNFVC